jgi:hypothetical protein
MSEFAISLRRARVLPCRVCRHQTTLTSGTVFQRAISYHAMRQAKYARRHLAEAA